MGDKSKIIVKVDKELSDIVPKFIENRKKDVIKIREALKAEDFSALRMMGHTLHGVGGGYGFDKVTDIGIEINLAAKKGSGDRIKELADELDDYIKRAEVVYE